MEDQEKQFQNWLLAAVVVTLASFGSGILFGIKGFGFMLMLSAFFGAVALLSRIK